METRNLTNRCVVGRESQTMTAEEGEVRGYGPTLSGGFLRKSVFLDPSRGNLLLSLSISG